MASEHDDDLLDIISDAIDESMDVDWTSRDGARHVLGALQIGGYIRTAAMDALIAESADMIDAPASADALGEVPRLPRNQLLYGSPDYLDDAEGLGRWRDEAKRGHGHDMASVNINSLRRLIDTIDRLSAALSAMSPAWQDIATAPPACCVLAAYFDHDAGESIMSVEFSPPQLPFTHWQLLPEGLAK